MTTIPLAAPEPPLLERRIRESLAGLDATVSWTAPGHLEIAVAPVNVARAVSVVLARLDVRYVISVGADRRHAGGGFDVLHCFAFDRAHVRCTVRARLDADKPMTPSITPQVPAASWAELEMYDMLGIESVGHPDPRPLMLPDDFPAGVHPLRKEVPHDYRPPAPASGAAPPETRPFRYREPPPGTTVIQLGPFFPVLEEPSQWRLFVDGENVVGVDYRGFYCHRAIEKLADSQLDYNQVVSLAERICGICGCVHSCSYCQSVESAAGIVVPPRAQVIRTLTLELERLQSHLLWLGLACHVVGFDFVFMHAWRLREPVLRLAEQLTGSRKHFGVNLVGGVSFDVPAARHEAVLAVAAEVEREAMKLVRAIQGDDALRSRLEGVGVLTADEVRESGAVGPTARGSGVAIDVRRDHPYAAYPQLEFEVVTHDGCDVWARTLVRAGEIFESIRLLRGCVRLLGELPEGHVMGVVPARLPAGREGLGAVEAPRGEVFHYVRLGERNGPDRWRVRAPSYQNLQAVPLMLKPGTQVADVPITLGSVDPCFSCTERMELIDTRGGPSRVLRQAELEGIARRDMEARRATWRRAHLAGARGAAAAGQETP